MMRLHNTNLMCCPALNSRMYWCHFNKHNLFFSINLVSDPDLLFGSGSETGRLRILVPYKLF
jgi:hypothetical protein